MNLKITFIGYATLLIEWNGLRILTDPLFSSRVLFFKRLGTLCYNPAQLPKLDAILLTHAHYDHLDLFSYKYIPGDVPIFIPEGMSGGLTHFVKNPVVELATWGRHTIAGKMEVCAVPAKHPGGRLFCHWRYPRCHGYVLTLGNESLYFAGDTAYRGDFADLKNLFPVKTALLPAAQVFGSFYSRKRHMNIDDMVQAWSDLGSPDLIPYHWGSFFKMFNSPDKIEERLKTKAARDHLLTKKLHLLKNGESWAGPPL